MSVLEDHRASIFHTDLEGFTAPGSKSLALVDNNASSRSGGWRQFVGPRRLLGKVRHSFGVC